MSQSHEPSRTPPPAAPRAPTRPESASTTEGLVAERAALAERERRTADARTAARRLEQAAERRP